MSNKQELDVRISANYLQHNHAEVMRIAYMLTAYATEEQLGFVLDATSIPLFADLDEGRVA
jgi:hypothetical protein